MTLNNRLIKNIGKSSFLLTCLIFLSTAELYGQQIGVFNSEHKLIYKYKVGRNLDFRIDYNKLYPNTSDSILESRVFGVIDSIKGKEIYLIENQVVLNFTKDHEYLVEAPLEYTSLVISTEDLMSVSFNPVMNSVGTAFIAIGVAALLVSPVLGYVPGESYATERFAIAAGMGLGSVAVGLGLQLGFSQKPVKLKAFNGPDYFKKYQPGSVSLLE
ncbi:MAG TPA: hypothetical protein DCX54_05150 [Flavobacteriales bacterium]|nr:hypothetical protein [Flavobacteriales bacterium]